MTNKCIMLYNHFISLYINYNIVIYLDPCTFGMGPFSMLKNMFVEVCNAPKLPVIPNRTPWSCGVSNGWLLRGSLAVWNDLNISNISKRLNIINYYICSGLTICRTMLHFTHL